jgi:hypothetical protein
MYNYNEEISSYIIYIPSKTTQMKSNNKWNISRTSDITIKTCTTEGKCWESYSDFVNISRLVKVLVTHGICLVFPSSFTQFKATFSRTVISISSTWSCIWSLVNTFIHSVINHDPIPLLLNDLWPVYEIQRQSVHPFKTWEESNEIKSKTVSTSVQNMRRK